MKDTGIVDIHGREYKTVALRVSEFRSAHGDWGILTEILEQTDTRVTLKASITNEQGRVLATGHAEEYRADGKINATSAVENAETSAIGRALAVLGYAGSEFASADEVARAMSGSKPSAPKASNAKPATDKQRGMIASLAEKKGLRPKLLAICSDVTGRSIESGADLSSAEASAVIDRLQEHPGDLDDSDIPL